MAEPLIHHELSTSWPSISSATFEYSPIGALGNSTGCGDVTAPLTSHVDGSHHSSLSAGDITEPESPVTLASTSKNAMSVTETSVVGFPGMFGVTAQVI